MINFTKRKNSYLIFSGVLALLSIIAIVVFGLNFGVELAGGTMIELGYPGERPPVEQVREELSQLDMEFRVQEITDQEGNEGYLIRTSKTETENVSRQIMNVLEEGEQRYTEEISATIGQELRRSTIIALILASLLIIIYIAFAFSGASGPVASWQYGVTAAVVAFFHDVLIIIGTFAVLGHFLGVQFTIPVVVALLTTLGYSLNDTVVIFDRIRENLQKMKGSFEEIVNQSLNQTLTRSINTSLTTLFVLLAILLLGAETLFYFVLALVLGVVLGTYSSLFVASSLLLKWREKFDKVK